MSNDRTSVLVPIAVLEGETIPEAIIKLLAGMDVTLLGYHVVPEQTAPEQAQEQFHEKVHRELAEYQERFERHGGTATLRTVFTHDEMQTFERVANELDIETVLLLNPAPAIDRILVPIRGEVNAAHIGRIAATLVPDQDTEIVLFHATKSEETRNDADELLADATETIVDAGVNRDAVRQEIVVSAKPIEAIKNAAETANFVVLGEHDPSIIDLVLGDVPERIAAASLTPVLVVRKRGDEIANENETNT